MPSNALETVVNRKGGEKMTNFIKLFRKNEDGSISSFPYDPNQNYYTFTQRVVQKGYTQCILTTDIMLQVAEQFILGQNGNISAIKMLVEDDELDKEISQLLERLNSNKAYWSILRERLSFLSNDAIDIESLEICGNSGFPYKITFRVNGILAFSGSESEKIVDKTMKIVGAYIK